MRAEYSIGWAESFLDMRAVEVDTLLIILYRNFLRTFTDVSFNRTKDTYFHWYCRRFHTT